MKITKFEHILATIWAMGMIIVESFSPIEVNNPFVLSIVMTISLVIYYLVAVIFFLVTNGIIKLLEVVFVKKK
jgi:hypothetical protein